MNYTLTAMLTWIVDCLLILIGSEEHICDLATMMHVQSELTALGNCDHNGSR